MTQTKENAVMVAEQPTTTAMDFFGKDFAMGQRMANLLASSKIVPKTFQGDIASSLIALNMAQRMGADPLQVMQSMYIVYGKPSFSSAFLIACFNQCGRFTPIKYEFSGEEGTDEWGCRAYTTEKATGEVIKGVKVTIGMAKAEGWWSKKDKDGRETSKWQTMPELMLRYRSASFLIRSTAPEISLGFQSVEEVRDVIDITNEAQIEGDAPNLKAIALQAVLEGDQEKPQAQPRENEEQKATDVAEAQPEQPQPARERESEKAQDFTSRFFEQHKHQEQ